MMLLPKDHYGSNAKLPLVQLWTLRVLVLLDGQKSFVSRHGFSVDAIAEALGLEKWIDPEDGDFDRRKVCHAIRKLHLSAEKELANSLVPENISLNLDRLAELVGLNSTDRKLLEFSILMNSEEILSDVTDTLGYLSSMSAIHAMSVILKISEQAIRQSFNAQGALSLSGLLTLDRNSNSMLHSKLRLLTEVFADTISSDVIDPVALLQDVVVPSAAGDLSLESYAHIKSDLVILLPYLKKSIAAGRRGVNIFLHGVPGTGKSQLAKVLAKELECELFEITSEDADGDPIGGLNRLRAFSAAQCFFAQRRSLIVFDEVEDVFNDGEIAWGRKSTAQTRKAWVNRILEGNSVPALWLSNSIYGLDPAFIRRFDMVFELPLPTKKQRESILRKNCGDILDDSQIKRIASVENLAPAVITKTTSVISSIKDELNEQEAATAFEQLINNTLEAQGHSALKKNDPTQLPEFYNPNCINADSDLAKISSGLIGVRSGRLCLYGPPGTGKTAYGRWVAEQMGVPLMIKRASDLMSMWVGENEKNIARAFHEAEQEGALLLIDEVDSFLQDRRGAEQGWQINLVNEMLTQMESFSGVFIASTNLMDGLDQAALRRFDLKVKFDFLLVDQAWQLLIEHCKKLQLLPPSQELRARVNCMHKLTPGDFAAVLRQHRFRSIETSAMFVAALEAECAIKEGVKRPMGFIH